MAGWRAGGRRRSGPRPPAIGRANRWQDEIERNQGEKRFTIVMEPPLARNMAPLIMRVLAADGCLHRDLRRRGGRSGIGFSGASLGFARVDRENRM